MGCHRSRWRREFDPRDKLQVLKDSFGLDTAKAHGGKLTETYGDRVERKRTGDLITLFLVHRMDLALQWFGEGLLKPNIVLPTRSGAMCGRVIIPERSFRKTAVRSGIRKKPSVVLLPVINCFAGRP